MLPEKSEGKTKQDENLFSFDADNIGCFFPSTQYIFIGLNSPILAGFGIHVSKNVSVIYFTFILTSRKVHMKTDFTIYVNSIQLEPVLILIVIFTVISLALFF